MQALSLLLAAALLLAAPPVFPTEGTGTALISAPGPLLGSARLRFFGLDIYEARLWAAPGFEPLRYAQHSFALELRYLRDFSGAAIAQRSILEMQRIERFSEEQAGQWQEQLRRLLPDVRSGDRLLGVHEPQRGLRLVYNGQGLGEIADPLFARLFMGIWLSPRSSEPALRRQLLGGPAS